MLTVAACGISKAGKFPHRFSRIEWPHGEILKTISANSSLKPRERETILVGSDRGGFNANNIELAVVAEQLPFDIETTAHEKDLNTLIERLSQASFFLYKEGGEAESPVFNPHFEELVRHALPDGGIVAIGDRLA